MIISIRWVSVWILLACMACFVTPLSGCYNGEGNENTSIDLNKEFTQITDIAPGNSRIFFIVDRSYLYYVDDGDDSATLVDSLPNAGFIVSKDVYVKSRTQLFKVIEQRTDPKLSIVPEPFDMDSIKSIGKIGETFENYEVIDCCNGEWGGTVSFINKFDTTQVNSIESTCLLKILSGPEYNIILNYMMHGMGSSSIYKIRSVGDLPNTEICHNFEFNLDSWTFVDSTMQAINTGGLNELIFDTTGVEIVDGQIIQDNLYVLLRSRWPDKIDLSIISNADIQTVDSYEFPKEDNGLSIDGLITANGYVYIRQSSWNYDRLKNGEGYENQIIIHNISTGKSKTITFTR
ncbi:hypothetical protein GGR26_000049 [Lewinella marina]|uniref:hypothetical protein n=1 Tax=Neolewinella marina TaxID=438751 RepID=UPI00117AA635|nr:hypothetical protein [Neolewinella marina]NJB84304.1 hypothetical protein [Neolewinella marina]